MTEAAPLFNLKSDEPTSGGAVLRLLHSWSFTKTLLLAAGFWQTKRLKI